MPEDIHASLWRHVGKLIESGHFAVTAEIYEELVHLPGAVGDCIRNNKDNLQFEIAEEHWDWESYLGHVERMRQAYKGVISEYNGNRKNTVGLNDISIIALGKTLSLPVISSEAKLRMQQESSKRQKIPDICDLEGVPHLSFNQFLRAEGIKT
jgi:hypothetical protein